MKPSSTPSPFPLLFLSFSSFVVTLSHCLIGLLNGKARGILPDQAHREVLPILAPFNTSRMLQALPEGEQHIMDCSIALLDILIQQLQ
jgi:hypothetical protein